MEKVQITTTVEVSQEQIDNMLCNAFEGGSTYWLEQVRVIGAWPEGCKFASETLTEGATLELLFDDGERVLTTLITQSSIQPALQQMADEYPLQFGELMMEQDDADTADLFLQLMAFKEVVYG